MSATAVPLRPHRTTLGAHSLKILCWESADSDIVAAARSAQARGEDLDQWTTAVIRAGAAATTVASAGADLSRLERAVDALGNGVSAQVGTAMSQLESAVARAVDPDHGQIAAASQAAVSRLADGVARLLTGPDATVPSRVQAAVREVTEQSLGEIQRALAAQAATVRSAITADRDQFHRTVLATVHEQHHELAQAIAEVRTSLAVREALHGEAARSSRKGFTFERACAELLGAIAAQAGDGGAEPVGGKTGVTGRKGDVLVELTSLGAPAPRMIVEAKDRAGNPLSVTDWRQELAAGRQNRGAAVALGITRPELMPVAGQRIVVLDERTLVLGWDPTEDDDQLATACYLMLRLTAAASTATGTAVPVAEVRRQVSDMLQSLTKLDLILQQAGTAQRALGRIGDATTTLRTDVEQRVAALQALLT